MAFIKGLCLCLLALGTLANASNFAEILPAKGGQYNVGGRNKYGTDEKIPSQNPQVQPNPIDPFDLQGQPKPSGGYDGNPSNHARPSFRPSGPQVQPKPSGGYDGNPSNHGRPSFRPQVQPKSSEEFSGDPSDNGRPSFPRDQRQGGSRDSFSKGGRHRRDFRGAGHHIRPAIPSFDPFG